MNISISSASALEEYEQGKILSFSLSGITSYIKFNVATVLLSYIFILLSSRKQGVHKRKRSGNVNRRNRNENSDEMFIVRK